MRNIITPTHVLSYTQIYVFSHICIFLILIKRHKNVLFFSINCFYFHSSIVDAKSVNNLLKENFWLFIRFNVQTPVVEEETVIVNNILCCFVYLIICRSPLFYLVLVIGHTRMYKFLKNSISNLSVVYVNKNS